MAENKDIYMTLEAYRTKATVGSKSAENAQNVTAIFLTTTENSYRDEVFHLIKVVMIKTMQRVPVGLQLPLFFFICYHCKCP